MSTIKVNRTFLVSKTNTDAFKIKTADKLINFDNAFDSTDVGPYDTITSWQKKDRAYILATDTSTTKTKILSINENGEGWRGKYDDTLSGITKTLATTVVNDTPYVFSREDDSKKTTVFRIHENGEEIVNEGKIKLETDSGLFCGITYKDKGLLAQFDNGTLYLYHVKTDHSISLKGITESWDSEIDLMVGASVQDQPFLLMYNSTANISYIVLIDKDGKEAVLTGTQPLEDGTSLLSTFPSAILTCIAAYNPNGEITYYSLNINGSGLINIGSQIIDEDIEILCSPSQDLDVPFNQTNIDEEISEVICEALLEASPIEGLSDIGNYLYNSSDHSTIVDAVESAGLTGFIQEIIQWVREISTSENSKLTDPVLALGLYIDAGMGIGGTFGTGIYATPSGEWGVYASEALDVGFIEGISAGISITFLDGGPSALKDISLSVTISGSYDVVGASLTVLLTEGDDDSEYLGIVLDLGFGFGSPVQGYVSVSKTWEDAINTESFMNKKILKGK